MIYSSFLCIVNSDMHKKDKKVHIFKFQIAMCKQEKYFCAKLAIFGVLFCKKYQSEY